MIWLTTPMQGSPKKRSILANADWLRATAEELSKSMIWLTTPMQGSPSSSLAVFGKRIRLIRFDLVWRLLLSP